MKKISDFLPQSINRAGINKEVKAALVCTFFEQAVKELNPEFANQTKPLKYVNKSLTIQVASAPLASELQMQHHKIINIINKKAGKRVVERISWRIVG